MRRASAPKQSSGQSQGSQGSESDAPPGRTAVWGGMRGAADLSSAGFRELVSRATQENQAEADRWREHAGRSTQLAPAEAAADTDAGAETEGRRQATGGSGGGGGGGRGSDRFHLLPGSMPRLSLIHI